MIWLVRFFSKMNGKSHVQQGNAVSNLGEDTKMRVKTIMDPHETGVYESTFGCVWIVRCGCILFPDDLFAGATTGTFLEVAVRDGLDSS